MKIRFPISVPYYDGLSINKYTEEVFDEDDDYVIITHDDTCDNGSLILTHKPYTEKVNQNVVLDNASAHRNERIKALVNKHNNLVYAVPYQHFTNSIENYFSMLKS